MSGAPISCFWQMFYLPDPESEGFSCLSIKQECISVQVTAVTVR